MQQIDAAAAQRDDQHAGREREKIEGGQAGVLLDHRIAGHAARQNCHRQAGDQTTESHCRQRQTGDQITDRRARQDRM
jgi:hypothetical protein